MAVAGKAGVCSCCSHHCKNENNDIGNASTSNTSTAPNAAAAAQHMSTAAECRHMIQSVAGDLLIASRSSHQKSSPHKLLKGSLILRNPLRATSCNPASVCVAISKAHSSQASRFRSCSATRNMVSSRLINSTAGKHRLVHYVLEL